MTLSRVPRLAVRLTIAVPVALSLFAGSLGTTSLAAKGVAARNCVWTSGQHIGKDCPGKTLHITFIQGETQDEYFLDAGKGAMDAGKAFNVQVNVQGARTYDPVAERPILNAVIQSHPDAVIVDPTDARALDDVLIQAAKAGIVVVTSDSDVANPALRVYQIGSNQEESGYLAGLAMGTALNNKGAVVALSASASNPIDSVRIIGFRTALHKYPGIRNLQNQYCTTDPTRCASVASALLSANPDIAGMFGSGEPMLKGEAVALRQAGKAGQVIIGGLDASPTEVHDLRTNVDEFLVAQQPYNIGYESIRITAEYLRGQQTSESPLLPKGTKLTALPSHVRTGFVIAVNHLRDCPMVAGVLCGLANDPKITKWYY